MAGSGTAHLRDDENVYIGVRWEYTLPARRATDILAQGNALGKRCRTDPEPCKGGTPETVVGVL